MSRMVFQSFDRWRMKRILELINEINDLIYRRTEHPRSPGYFCISVVHVLWLAMFNNAWPIGQFSCPTSHSHTHFYYWGWHSCFSLPAGAIRCGLNKRGSLSIHSKQLGCFHHMGLKLNSGNSGSIVNVHSGRAPWLLVSKGKIIHWWGDHLNRLPLNAD